MGYFIDCNADIWYPAVPYYLMFQSLMGYFIDCNLTNLVSIQIQSKRVSIPNGLFHRLQPKVFLHTQPVYIRIPNPKMENALIRRNPFPAYEDIKF
ncbi:MAG: hypothetical protein D6732_28895 [Methanobacteriota archaeon]|nr:MAG: hypothetical protein D6732_28895 [Euryarchaeota archaeon]